MESYTTGIGQKIKIHSEEDCSGKCPIHNPSDHILKDAPTNWRSDRGIFERICRHGIGHPDPDTLSYLESQGIEDPGIHGCDGCCQKKGGFFINSVRSGVIESLGEDFD